MPRTWMPPDRRRAGCPSIAPCAGPARCRRWGDGRSKPRARASGESRIFHHAGAAASKSMAAVVSRWGRWARDGGVPEAWRRGIREAGPPPGSDPAGAGLWFGSVSADVPADLPSRIRDAVHVHVGRAIAHRPHELSELTGADAAVRRADHVGGVDDAGH